VSEPLTAIALLLEDAAPEVASARAELDPETAARIPFHVTLLHPFVPRRRLDAPVSDALRGFFAARPPLAFDLVSVEEFPGVVAYAAPDPTAELLQLMRELWDRFPDTPPYGGAFAEPVPHATLCRLDEGGDASPERARARVQPLLPVRCRLDAAALLEEYEPGCWRQLRPLPFGAGP
jgi:2'-5' RNA ligase